MANGYSELDPYGNYGDKHTLSPYEMLMQMKAWNKEIYLTIENNDEQVRTQLSVLDGEIRQNILDVKEGLETNISTTAAGIQADITNTAAGLQTQITANAQGVASKVSQTDFNGNTVASLITQTPTAITAMAQALNLNGYVTFNSLTASGTTVIDGARIGTGYISADRLQASTILAKVIAAGGISADNITSGTISAARLSASTISSVLINAGGINASMITSGTISAERLSASTIRTLFLQAGSISADYISGGTLTGVSLSTSQDITVGNNIHMATGNSGSKNIIFGGVSRIVGDWGSIYLSSPYVDITGTSVRLGGSSSTVTFGGTADFTYSNVVGLARANSSGIGISTSGGFLYVQVDGSTIGSVKLT